MTSPAPPRSAGRPRSPAADQAILDTAVRLLAEQGYDAMSIEGVAAAAGVGKTTIYRRYPSKRELVIAALSRFATIAGPAPDTGSTRDDLLALVREMLDLLRRSGLGLSMIGTLLVKERDEPALIQLFREGIVQPRMELAGALLARGIERGELRGDLRPEIVIPMLIGSVFARHIAGLPDGDEWLDALFDTAWEGIAVR